MFADIPSLSVLPLFTSLFIHSFQEDWQIQLLFWPMTCQVGIIIHIRQQSHYMLLLSLKSNRGCYLTMTAYGQLNKQDLIFFLLGQLNNKQFIATDISKQPYQSLYQSANQSSTMYVQHLKYLHFKDNMKLRQKTHVNTMMDSHLLHSYILYILQTIYYTSMAIQNQSIKTLTQNCMESGKCIIQQH